MDTSSVSTETSRFVTDPDIRWLQDLSNEDIKKVTRGEGDTCPCPNCGHAFRDLLEDVKVKKDDQTPFSARCMGGCRKSIQFVVFHENADNTERTFVYAACYRRQRKRRK